MKRGLLVLIVLLSRITLFAQDCTPSINMSFNTPGVHPVPLIGSIAGIPYDEVGTWVLNRSMDNILTAPPGDSIILCAVEVLQVTGLPIGYSYEIWASHAGSGTSYDVMAQSTDTIHIFQNTVTTKICIRLKNPNPPVSSNMSDGLPTRDTVDIKIAVGLWADLFGCASLVGAGGTDTVDFKLTIRDSLNSITACDSQLIFSPASLNSSQSFTICQGDSIIVGTNTYTSSGNYSDIFPAINGCDSTVATHLTVTPPPNHTQGFVICSGDSVFVGSSVYTSNGSYVDTFTTASGCDSNVTTNVLVISCAGIEDELNPSFSIYPNPTTGIINLNALKNNQNASLEISTMLGQVVLNKNISLLQGQNYQLDISSLPNGIYIISVGRFQSRIIKQ